MGIESQLPFSHFSLAKNVSEAAPHSIVSFTAAAIASPTQARLPQGANLLAPREQVPSRDAMARTVPHCSAPYPACCTYTTLQWPRKLKSGIKNYEASSCSFQSRFAGVRTGAGCTGELWCTRIITRVSKGMIQSSSMTSRNDPTLVDLMEAGKLLSFTNYIG